MRWVSAENVELVRTIYDRFRAGDEEAALALIDPAMEIRERSEAPDPEVYRGPEGTLNSLGNSRAAFDELDVLPLEFVDAGEQVAVEIRFAGKGRESGVPIDERLGHLWTIRDGRAVSLTVHSSLRDAMATLQ